MNEVSDANELGWNDGYDCKEKNNPYNKGTKDYNDYEEGYSQGEAEKELEKNEDDEEEDDMNEEDN